MRVGVNLLVRIWFLLKWLLILSNEDPRTARSNFEFNLKPAHDGFVLPAIAMVIYLIFFSRKLFIYIGHLPIIGDYLDRFCRNIHSYCSISGVPGFIFLKNCWWQHPEMLVLGFYNSEIAQNINFYNLVNWRKKMHVFSLSGFWYES